jgi:hypothetical protein
MEPKVHATEGGGVIDVLDRVLDKGIVIDAYVRVSVAGIDLLSVDARVVVASVVTYLHYADSIGATPSASRPQLITHRPELDRTLGTSATTAFPTRRGSIPS